jgi:hypothetical protein
MGFLRDLRTLRQQSKEIEYTWDPGVAAQVATARLAAFNTSVGAVLTPITGPSNVVSGQITGARPTGGVLNMDPIIAIDLLLFEAGRPPRPLTANQVVPRLRPGTSVPVRVSTTDPNAVAVDWNFPSGG